MDKSNRCLSNETKRNKKTAQKVLPQVTDFSPEQGTPSSFVLSRGVFISHAFLDPQIDQWTIAWCIFNAEVDS
jgi:hypothetical protein